MHSFEAMQSQYQTEGLLVNFVTCPKKVRLVDHFPELHAFKGFTQQQDDNVIRIAILTSDAKSPFWVMRSDREKMIKAIFDFLEIGIVNKIGKELFQKVLEFKHEGVSQCWVAYLQMQYNIDFNDWLISWQTYEMLLAESTRQKGDSEDSQRYAEWRVKLRNQMRQIGDDLKQIEPKIFKDSRMAAPVAAEIRKIKSYPEKHAIMDSLM